MKIFTKKQKLARAFLTFLAIFIGLSIFITVPSSVKAQSSDWVFQFNTAYNDGNGSKCLHVRGDTRGGNGVPATLWECIDQANVKWYLDDAGKSTGGYQLYYLRSAYSGRCLQVNEASQQNGALITQWDCDNRQHFKWAQAVSLIDESFQFKSENSRKCLRAYVQRDGSIPNNTPIVQWDCNTTDAGLLWLSVGRLN